MIDIAVPGKPSARERVKEKLFSIGSDIKNSKIRTSINTVEQTDGKITATFNINGLPATKGSFDDSYRNIPKIFDTMDAFTQYATEFFNKTDEEIISLAKTERSN